jgi:hypothetical protein
MKEKINNSLDWIIGDDNTIVMDYYVYKNRKYFNSKSYNLKKLVYDYFTNILNEFKQKNNIKFKLNDVEFRKRVKKIISCLKNDIDRDKLQELLNEFISDKDNIEPYSLLFLLIIISDIDDELISDKKLYLKYFKQLIKLDMQNYSGLSNIFDKFLMVEKERMKTIDVVKFYI